MDRKYSLSEIDTMRAAVHRLVYRDAIDRSRAAVERVTEDRLRTYMMAGTSPEELQEAAKDCPPAIYIITARIA